MLDIRMDIINIFFFFLIWTVDTKSYLQKSTWNI